jgi:hypothetical protein
MILRGKPEIQAVAKMAWSQIKTLYETENFPLNYVGQVPYSTEEEIEAWHKNRIKQQHVKTP